MKTDPILAGFDALTRRDGNAVIVLSPLHRATRAEVAACARAVEREVAASGVPEGAYVLIACANGPGFLAALVGVRRSGRVPVFADAAAPPDERMRIAQTLGIAVEISCDVGFPSQPAALRMTPLATTASEPPLPAHYVKMTSGSTGAPSGIAITAEALAADDEQLATTMGLHASDRILAEIPWSHSYALSSAVLPALGRGCTLVMSESTGPWAPLQAAQALDATFFPTVPVYLAAIASLAAPPAFPASIRTVVSAGAPLRPETASRFHHVFGRRAHVFYGASECGGICYDREGEAAMRGTVGTPVDGVTVTILPEGTVHIRSAAAGTGYVPEENDRLGGGAFVASDLGAFTAAGELELLGRADALINVGGKKVQPAEVEGVLRAMPGVKDAVVLGVSVAGTDREVVRAVVACDPSITTYESVAAWCRPRLAAHKVPRSVTLVDAIPRTSRGKVDRAALSGLLPAGSRD